MEEAALQGREAPFPCKQGCHVEIQLMLGQIHLNRGELSHAFDLFVAAAQSGHPQALNMLGRAYERGWGVPKNASRARSYFECAAAQGDGWAAFNLGDLYFSGNGVFPDRERAFGHYVAAARKGVVKALNMLGILCEDGIPARKCDRESARLYFRAGAEGGDCWAAFNMGRLSLEDGDIEVAVRWYENALINGFPDCWAALKKYLETASLPVLQNIGIKASERLATFQS